MNDLQYNTVVYNRILSVYVNPTTSDLSIVAGIWLPMNRNQEKSSMANKINYLMDAKMRVFYLDSHIPVAE